MRYLTGRARSREEVLEEWLPVLTREAGPDGVLGYWAGLTDAASSSGGGASTRPRTTSGRPSSATGCAATRGAKAYATEGAWPCWPTASTTVGLDRIWAQTMAVNTGRLGP